MNKKQKREFWQQWHTKFVAFSHEILGNWDNFRIFVENLIKDKLNNK